VRALMIVEVEVAVQRPPQLGPTGEVARIVAQVNPVFTSGSVALPSFLQPLTAVGARRMQFSLDFEF